MASNIYRRLWSGLMAASALFGADDASAQSDSTRKDSIRVYRLGEISVTDGRAERVTPSRTERVPLARIDATDASTAAGVAYLVPAARIQTNSRGESLLYLRGAGERQVAVFLDGALLNIPWDNRVDLSLVPLNAVGGITVTKGVPSVLYGTNVTGGAVNIVSQELRAPGYLTEVTAQGGSGALAEGTITHIGNLGSFNYISSFGYMTRDGFTLPDTTELRSNTEAPFLYHQTDPTLRTNTDSRVMSLFMRGEYAPAGPLRLGLSVNYIDAEKGVAPEANSTKPRFWRYPEWRNLTVAANGDVRFGADESWNFKGAAWWNGFTQAIDQYGSVAYGIHTSREEDRDNTIGTRLLLRKEIASHALTLAVNAYQSSHDQQDFRYDSAGTLRPFIDASGAEVPYPTMAYQQQIYSIGLEYESTVTEGLNLTLGGNYDGMNTPKTGDKPTQEGFGAFGFSGGLSYQPIASTTIRLSSGVKSRFPTMRELYGEALGRFLINPDLKPEESVLLELGVEVGSEIGSISVTGFGVRTNNTIDQRTFDTLGAERRQRINLEGSRAMGVEIAGALRAIDHLIIDGHLAYIHNRAKVAEGSGSSFTGYLAERPEMLATLAARYDFPFGLQPMVELVRNGQAFSPTSDGFVPLGPSTVLNARLAYRLMLPLTANFSGEVFIRANNITNEVVLPQLGLPAAGREIQGGVKVTF